MNLYDDVRVDVPRLLMEQERQLLRAGTVRSAKGFGPADRVSSLLQLYGTGALMKAGLFEKLIYSNWSLGWFREFREYWVDVLGNRPITPCDFYFLYGSYRSKFQELRLPDASTDDQHLDAWRAHQTMFLLFQYQHYYARVPLWAYPFAKYVPRNGTVCEFGCGIAPITMSLARYYRHLNFQATIADIPHLIFHYARWRFRDMPFVEPLELDVSHDTPLTKTYDVIFCRQVLEHVPRPIALARHLHERLSPGGHLVFDFVRSEGKGLDSRTALQDRLQVLAFMREQFLVVEGTLPLDGRDVGTVVARKRS